MCIYMTLTRVTHYNMYIGTVRGWARGWRTISGLRGGSCRRRSPRGDAVKRQTGPPSRAAAARLLCVPSAVYRGGDVKPAGRFAISTSPVRRKRTGRHCH